MPEKRRFHKRDRVHVYSTFDNRYLCTGTILGWTYDRSEKAYEYLVEVDPDTIKKEFQSDKPHRNYFEQSQLKLVKGQE